ncbi:MAG: hypothetical protein ACPG77_04950 [Nannocystaceae bacterium]
MRDTIVGTPTDPEAQALHRAARILYAPQATLAWSAPGERYPDRGKPAVYLCTDSTCSPPIFDAAAVPERGRLFLESL